MASFWFISAPLFSHTDWGGFLKTAQEIQARGHDVLWISGEAIAGAVQQAGLEFRAIRETGWLWPPPPPPDLTTIPPQEAVNLRYKRALDTWLSEDIVAEATQAIIELADDIGAPDIIVTDPFLSAAALAAEALNVKLIVCGWQAQDDLNADILFPIQRNLGTDSQQRLRRLFDRFGLEGVNFAKGATPSIISPYLHICYFTREWYLAESDTLLQQNRFVGGEASIPTSAPPHWLQAIPEDVPLGLVTLGSVFTGDLGFFSWGAQALAQAGVVPIVAIGWNPIEPDKKQELLNALPKGTRLLNWVPFEHVLPRAKIMIHHGGMGTTHYAIVNGLVQIVVPHAADQRVQARRVAQAKIGLNLSAHDVRQGMLWEGTRALLQDQTVQKTAKQMKAQMSALGGVKRAADEIIAIV
ncbi:MAG: glycosyltransferase [Aggregatilineales bacterium]